MQEKINFSAISKVVITYVVWLVVTVSMVALTFLLHDTLITALLVSRINPWGLRALDMWSMVILGLFALIFIFLSEGYLRDGMRINRFWPRVARILLIEGGIALAAVIVRALV